MTFHKKDRRTILAGALLGAVSGLLSFAFLAFLNFMIGNLLAGQYTRFSITHGLIFALIIVSYIWARRSLSFKIIRLSQAFFWKLRLRVLSIVLKSDFQAFTQRRDQVHSVLVHDVGTLTQASLSIIEFITSSVVVLACFIYMGLVSIPLFLVTIGTATLGILIYQLGTRVSNRQFEASRDLEDGFMRYFNAVLQGFKEIHMDGRIGQSIYRRQISPIAEGAYQNNTRAFTGFLNNQITGQVLFYALIASILLFFSVNLDIETGTTVNFLFILLYLLSSLETIMVLLPALARARISLGRIRTLQAELQQSTNEARTIMATTHPEPFTGLEVSGMTFSYPATEQQPEGFSIGPANLAIEPGQINFIYGGNGSGKTTFMHSFLGLLRPNEGTITFNGRTLADENYGEYKRLFSVVFNDFYLFDQFYGNEGFDVERARNYLSRFDMEGRVEITEHGFSTTELSTGQRKRLALISAILEDKPILVLDEWAADQDPYFRRKFYEEILPELKAEGRTVLAITHDDAYYRTADKVYRMEYGKLIDDTAVLVQDQPEETLT